MPSSEWGLQYSTEVQLDEHCQQLQQSDAYLQNTTVDAQPDSKMQLIQGLSGRRLTGEADFTKTHLSPCIDDDALPALQSPASTSPAPPQALSPALLNPYPSSTQLKSGQGINRRWSGSMLPAPETTAYIPSRCGAQHASVPSTRSMPAEQEARERRLVAAHNAASQTQVSKCKAFDECVQRCQGAAGCSACPNRPFVSGSHVWQHDWTLCH